MAWWGGEPVLGGQSLWFWSLVLSGSLGLLGMLMVMVGWFRVGRVSQMLNGLVEAWDEVEDGADKTAAAFPPENLLHVARHLPSKERKEMREALELARRELALHKDPRNFNVFNWKDGRGFVATEDPIDLLLFLTKNRLALAGLLNDVVVPDAAVDAYDTMVYQSSTRVLPKDHVNPVIPNQDVSQDSNEHTSKETQPDPPEKEKGGGRRKGHSKSSTLVSEGSRPDPATQNATQNTITRAHPQKSQVIRVAKAPRKKKPSPKTKKSPNAKKGSAGQKKRKSAGNKKSASTLHTSQSSQSSPDYPSTARERSSPLEDGLRSAVSGMPQDDHSS